jgi:hypothetical protein
MKFFDNPHINYGMGLITAWGFTTLYFNTISDTIRVDLSNEFETLAGLGRLTQEDICREFNAEDSFISEVNERIAELAEERGVEPFRVQIEGCSNQGLYPSAAPQ